MPFVIIQCIMVGLVIGFPSMVMHYKSAASTVDPKTIEIKVPSFGLGPNFGGSGPAEIKPPDFK